MCCLYIYVKTVKCFWHSCEERFIIFQYYLGLLIVPVPHSKTCHIACHDGQICLSFQYIPVTSTVWEEIIDYYYFCCYSLLLQVCYFLTSKKESVSLYSSHTVSPYFYSLSYGLSLASSNLLIHAGLLAFLPDFLLVRKDYSWPWKKWSLNMNQLYLGPWRLHRLLHLLAYF